MDYIVDNKKERIAVSIAIGAIAAAIFVVLITILAEQVPPIKSWLKEEHFHHWVGKGIWTAVVFIVTFALSYLLAAKVTFDGTLRSLNILTYTLLIGTLVLFCFFTLEFFGIITH